MRSDIEAGRKKMKISDLNAEELTSRLILAVINYKENEDKIGGYPFVKKGNFAILTQLCVGEKNDVGQYTACLTVTNDLLEQWGLSKEQLFDIAADNSKKMFPSDVQPLTNYTEKSLLKVNVELPDDMSLNDVIVLTNQQHFNGAATLFYEPGILHDIAKEKNVNQLVLMPSGVNQIYCIPMRDNMSLEECKSLYQNLIDMIDKDNRLADSILSFNSQSGMVTEVDGESYPLNLNNTSVRRAEHRR